MSTLFVLLLIGLSAGCGFGWGVAQRRRDTLRVVELRLHDMLHEEGIPVGVHEQIARLATDCEIAARGLP